MKLKPLCLAVAVAITGCGGGGGGSSSSPSTPAPTPTPTTTLSGSAVKGPLVNATVRAYALDTSAADLKGALLDSGSTDAQAAITGLAIASSTTGPVLLEILADSDTVDLTTGVAPVITRMVTVRDAADLMNGDAYATPLTTMVVELARKNGDKNILGYSGDNSGSLTEAEFLAALPVAQSQVKASLGFGLVDGVDIMTQSPLITEDTTDAASQAAVLNYRTALEGVAAIAEKLKDDALAANAGSTVSTDDMFAALASDLSDGALDGQDDDGALAAMADVPDVGASVTVDPSTLTIPGTTTPLTEVSDVLIAEKQDTGISTDTTEIENAETTPAVVEPTPDSDGDGVDDLNDAFPMDDSETTDTDGDNVGDNADVFPDDPEEWADFDSDGTGDNADDFPADPNETTDTDGDGTGDNADEFPNDASETTDTDGDGVGDNADDFPNDASETTDSDGDGVGNNTDNCPTVSNPDQADTDTDGVGDACEEGQTPTGAVWDQFNWDDGSTWQ